MEKNLTRIVVELYRAENYLFTLDHPFMAKDGRQYRSIWGPVQILGTQDLFGMRPTQMTNFVYLIGNVEKRTVVAGCQIKFAQPCPNPPKINMLGKILGLFSLRHRIYFAN